VYRSEGRVMVLFPGEGEESGFVDLGPATLLPPGSRVGVDD